MNEWKKFQPALDYAWRNPGKNVSLSDLASRTGQSRFDAHRKLHALLGETPKQFTLRLRVDRAAAALVSSQVSILDIALVYGFESPEAFCRAFRRRFGITPSVYRKRARMGPEVGTHARLVGEIGPCIGIYRIEARKGFLERPMEYVVSRRELPAQPVLVVRRRVRRGDIAATIGAELPKVFLYAQQRGIAIAGYPITRYLEVSMGMVTLETGMRVTAHSGEWKVDNSEAEVLDEMLPGGPAAVTIHTGPYDELQFAYAALEQWIAANQLRPNGAPWEGYLNDPADHPDPQEWRTEVYWPVKI